MAADTRLARETPPLKAKDVLAVAGDDIPAWVRRLVWLMDDAIKIPGTEVGVGLDAIIGAFVPGVGDALTGLTTLALLYVAVKRGVPAPVVFRMIGQQVVDFGFGSIPVVGDVFDVLNRANRRNLELIEKHAGSAAPATFRDRALVGLAILLALGLVLLPIVIAVAAITALVRYLGS